MRFNSPPNWPPPPPGWSPPPGWQPDPSWPTPPPGWPLWVPDVPRRRTGLIAGGIVAALAVIAIAVVAVVVVTSNSEPTDEERIRTIVNGLEDTYNRSDFDAFQKYLCNSLKDEIAEDSWHSDDRWSLTIESLEVTGDKATVSVTNDFDGTDEPETEDISFVREDGGWKACHDE